MNVTEQLTAFIVGPLSGGTAGAVDPDEDLIERGLIDSLGIIELLSFIDDKFGVSLPPDEVVPENFRSVRALAALIEAKRR